MSQRHSSLLNANGTSSTENTGINELAYFFVEFVYHLKAEFSEVMKILSWCLKIINSYPHTSDRVKTIKFSVQKSVWMTNLFYSKCNSVEINS